MKLFSCFTGYSTEISNKT